MAHRRTKKPRNWLGLKIGNRGWEFLCKWVPLDFEILSNGGLNCVLAGSFLSFYRDIGRRYSTANSAFDWSTRRNLVRYNTSEWYGFVASASWGRMWTMA